MPFINRFGFVIFGILAVIDIVFLSLEHNNWRYYTKPLLLPVLLIIILSQSKDQPHPTAKRLVTLALIAGTVGDVYLLGTEAHPEYFMYGIIAFLIMQLLYAIYFFRMQALKTENMVVNLFIALLLGGFAFALVGSLYKFMGNLQVPVVVYAVAICLMLFAAVNVYHSKRAQKLAAQFFIPGAAFLVLSDAVLAANIFYLKSDTYDVSVMVTYILGQLFLSIGFIKHLKSSRHKKSRSRRRRGSEDEPVMQ